MTETPETLEVMEDAHERKCDRYQLGILNSKPKDCDCRLGAHVKAWREQLAEKQARIDEMSTQIMRLPKPPEDIGDGPQERIDHVLAKLEQAEKDAKRYRFLRGDGKSPTAYRPEENGIWGGKELDDFCDSREQHT
jgi:hypothetical protein